MLEIRLPYPPTMNRAWRMVNGRMLISREGRLYRRQVGVILAANGVRPIPGRLALAIHVRPLDQRRRDLDNVQKGMLDAMEIGGAYEDDSQVDLLVTRRGPVVAGGDVHVGYKLGPRPPRLDSEDDLPEYVPSANEEVPF